MLALHFTLSSRSIASKLSFQACSSSTVMMMMMLRMVRMVMKVMSTMMMIKRMGTTVFEKMFVCLSKNQIFLCTFEGVWLDKL